MSQYTLKLSIFSLPISHVKIGVKMSGFLGVQRQNYCFDFKCSLYVVTYYKVYTTFLRIFPSEFYNIRENLRKPSPICQKQPILIDSCYFNLVATSKHHCLLTTLVVLSALYVCMPVAKQL